MGKKTAVLFVIMTLGLSLLTGCGKSAATGGFNPSQGLVVSGSIEAKEVDLNTKIPGKIVKIYVEEGQQVKSGDLIAEIESEQLQAKKAQIEAKVEAAKQAVDLQEKVANANIEQANGAYQVASSQLQKAQNGARNEEVEQAKSYYELMQKTFNRVQKLYEKGAVSAQKRDEVEAQLSIAKQKYQMAQEGARQEDINTAAGLVSQAQGALSAANAGKMQVQLAQQKYQEALAGLEEIESLLADTKIIAPIEGTVTEINTEAGEMVSTGMPLATVSNLNNMWVDLKVNETDLDKVMLDQEVKVRIPNIEEKTFTGKVTRISKKPDFATKRSTNDQNDTDILAYGVKVEMTNIGAKIYPGMTVYVQFPNAKN